MAASDQVPLTFLAVDVNGNFVDGRTGDALHFLGGEINFEKYDARGN
ncbi:MAG: hypothetical protein M0T78_00625 [Actinomycetota bacterium]|nr:hypothetical protein [Actinomycetota bacterium]